MPNPAEVLLLLQTDSTRPRITTYDDTQGPTSGERIELSARVLTNWVNKAGNALQDEFALGPGDVVRLALPPHWRTLYWALAAWSVGVEVSLDAEGDDPALVITDDPLAAGAAQEAGTQAVLVTLAALARSANPPAPEGVMDEARELATHPDAFSPDDEPDPDDVALRADGEYTAYGRLVRADTHPARTRLHTDTTDPATFLRTAVDVFAVDGSLVLTRGHIDPARLEERCRVEGVTEVG